MLLRPWKQQSDSRALSADEGDCDSDGDCQEIAIMWRNPGASTRQSDGVQFESNIVDFTASEDLYSLSLEHTREDSIVRVF